MPLIWDYPTSSLARSKRGRTKLLERLVNFGPITGEKVPLKKVKKHWKSLRLFPNNRILMELLIWGQQKKLGKESVSD